MRKSRRDNHVPTLIIYPAQELTDTSKHSCHKLDELCESENKPRYLFLSRKKTLPRQGRSPAPHARSIISNWYSLDNDPRPTPGLSSRTGTAKPRRCHDFRTAAMAQPPATR